MESIINELHQENLKEIPTRMIGPAVMKRLQNIDPVAFVRYASVYRRFQDVGEFIDEIQSLERVPQKDTDQKELFR